MDISVLGLYEWTRVRINEHEDRFPRSYSYNLLEYICLNERDLYLFRMEFPCIRV